ncbi:MAG: TVP38/TMEM64 family protein [Desulfobaccales bacterium]
MVDLAYWLRLERIHDLLGKAGWLAPLIYMCMMALAVIIAIIPSLPLNVAAGAFFGPLLGTLYSTLGATVGAVAAFLIARYLGREFIDRFIRGHNNFCIQCSNRLLTKVIFISRLIPFISFDVVSYGAGLTQVSLRAFTLASFFGMLPLTFIYNQFGAGLVMNQALAISLGFLMVILMFIAPSLIERYNLFSLRQYFRHAKEKTTDGADIDI